MEQDIDALVEQKVKEILDRELDQRMADFKHKDEGEDRSAIIATKGTLDMAYPPLILASVAAGAMDMETSIFFSFYGLDIINKKKNKNLQVPSLANPAMPIPVPNWIGVLPGMTAVATSMMKKWMKNEKVPTIPELIDLCLEAEVKLIGCQMTMDVMGIKRSELIDEIEVGGAASFLEFASKANLTLFI